MIFAWSAKTSLDRMWESLKKRIVLDPEVPLNGGTYLGCTQYDIEAPARIVQEKRDACPELTTKFEIPKVTCAKNDEFLKHYNAMHVSKKHKDIAKREIKLRAWEYEMTGHAEKCVEKYLELANLPALSLRKSKTPTIDDHAIPADEFEV